MVQLPDPEVNIPAGVKTAFSSPSGEAAGPNYSQSYPSYCEIFSVKWKQLEVPRTLHKSIVLLSIFWLSLSSYRQCQRASSTSSGGASKGLQCKDSSVFLPGVKMYMGMIQGWFGSLYSPFSAVTWVLFLSNGVSASQSSDLLPCGDELQSRLSFQIWCILGEHLF